MEPRFLQSVKWNKDPPPWLTSNHQSGAVRGVLHWCQLALQRQPWPMRVQGGVCNHACYPSSFWASINRSLVYNSLWPRGLYSPPDSSVHGILQAKILEWVAIIFSKGYCQPRDGTPISCIPERFLTAWATCLHDSVAFLHFLKLPQSLFPQDLHYNGFLLHLHSVETTLQPLDLGLLLHCTPGKELRSWYEMQFLKKTSKPLP